VVVGRAADTACPTDASTEEEDAGAGEDREQQSHDDEKTSTAWSRSCWSWCDGQN